MIHRDFGLTAGVPFSEVIPQRYAVVNTNGCVPFNFSYRKEPSISGLSRLWVLTTRNLRLLSYLCAKTADGIVHCLLADYVNAIFKILLPWN